MSDASRQNATERAPDFADNRRFWIGLLAAFVLLCILGEVWARSLGVEPMLNDTPSSWALMRESVGPDDVVVVGTSRGQRGIDPAVLQEYAGDRRVVLLARTGTGALPVVEHLAEDETFRGTVIVDIHPNHWQYSGSRLAGNLNGWALIAAYENRAASLPLEMTISRWFQRRVAILSPEFTIDGIVRAIGRIDPVPGRNHLRFTERRFVEHDGRWFDEVAHDRLQARKNENLAESAVADRNRVAEAAAELRAPVEALRQRGVRVVFVRTPSSKHSRERENHRVPRNIVFDTLVEEVGGEWLHFEDATFEPTLVCPDGSHLDTASAHVFTRWLGEVVFGEPAAGI